MSIKVTFEFDTAHQAAVFLADCGDANGASAGETAGDAPAPAAAGARRPGRPRKVDAAPAVEPAAPVATAAAQAGAGMQNTAPAAIPVQFETVINAVSALADADTPKAKALLATFGVKLARELKPEQFADVVKAFTEAMNKPTKESLV